MDKISSIIPGNARVQSVDTEGSQAARPGSSTLGRHEGISSVHDRLTLSDAARNASMQDSFKDTMGGARAKDMARAKMVAEINRNFFESRIKPVAAPAAQASEAVEESAMESTESLEPQKEVPKDSFRESLIAKYSQPAIDRDGDSENMRDEVTAPVKTPVRETPTSFTEAPLRQATVE